MENPNTFDTNYIKSCIRDHKGMMEIYKNTRKNIIDQIETLSEEESALTMPGNNGDNLGIRSFGIVDTVYSQHAQLARSNLFKRQQSLMKYLDSVEERIDSLHRILQIFNMVALLYPIHYGIADAYLHEGAREEDKKDSALKEDSGYRRLENEYGSSHKTLRLMVNNVCELVRELTIEDLNGANIAALSEPEIKDKLSKELVESLDKYEFNQRKGKKQN